MAAPKGLLAILGAGPKDEEEPDQKVMAAKDLIRAVKSGDAGGVASAFQDMYDACAMGGHSEPDEDDEDYGAEGE